MSSTLHAVQDPSDPAQFASYAPTENAFIHESFNALANGDVSAMDKFVFQLDALRRRVSTADWHAFVSGHVAKHPIRALIHEEPFARRAFQKPRGYAGDAPMLDLIYGDMPYHDALTSFGAQLHLWTGFRPAAQSVRERRTILARLIDEVAASRPAPRILSLACGHLREAQRSAAVRSGRVQEFVALDQDPDSIALVAREQEAVNVTPIRTSVGRFLAAPARYGTFDFAYSAGLYDYLDARTATSLTRALFSSLRPGGTMLIANFAPNLADIGYMEAIMDWKLVYRDEDAVGDLASSIPAEEIAEQSLFRDDAGNVVYLTMRRRE